MKIDLKAKKILVSWLCCCFIAWIFLFWQLPDNRFHIYFLDVGQGDAIFIKTAENHQILVDGGPGNKVLEELGEVMPYFDKSLDFMVLSHPDYDHLSGLVEVLKRYEVKNILMTGVDAEKATYTEFLEEIVDQGVNVYPAEAGIDFWFGGMYMDVLFPFEQLIGQKVQNHNDYSVVMKLIHEDFSVLLTGDLEEAEEQLVQRVEDLRAKIFKAGHHGSKSSSSLGLLKRVKPEIVVIQVGKDNSYGHPHEDVLKNFEVVEVKKVYRNDQDGRVEFVF